MNGGHQQVSLDGGTYHCCELIPQLVFVRRRQRYHPPYGTHHVVAITDQKIGQVKRNEQADDKVKRVLPNVEELRGRKLRAL